jgi:signal recognition particle receptor subunit beta
MGMFSRDGLREEEPAWLYGIPGDLRFDLLLLS